MNKQTELAELGDGVYVNAEALIDGRALVQANSGGGKSYTIQRPLSPAVRATLEVIVKHNGLSLEQLAEKLGKSASRGLGNYVSELRTRGLVNKGWPATATSVLYMERA